MVITMRWYLVYNIAIMVELYGRWGGTKHTSYREIQEMKKNMQKVPTIQKKSEQYHKKEEQDAEKILNMVDEEEEKWPIIPKDNVDPPRWKKRRKKIVFKYL